MAEETNPLKETKEEKQKLFTKAYVIGLIISLAATVSMGVIIFFARYYGGMLGTDDRLFISLTDAFSISGFLSILFFLIVWVSNYGAFDAISYSIQLMWNNIFHRNIRDAKLPRTYAEYRELKRGKQRANTTFMLFPGLLFLTVGVILLIIYNVK